MALHGEISIGGHQIAWWSARRTEELISADSMHHYDVEVIWPAAGPHTVPFKYTTGVWHRYSDGAVKLAALVMEAAALVAPKFTHTRVLEEA